MLKLSPLSVHFQQKIAFADFGNSLFHHHRLRGFSRHFQQGMQAGVVLIGGQRFGVAAAASVQRAVGCRKRGHYAAEHHFLAEVFLGLRIGDVLAGAVNQIAAGFGDFIGVHAVAFGIHHAVVRAGHQLGRVLRLLLVDDLRMLHEHAVEIDVDRLDAVAGADFTHARIEFDGRDAAVARAAFHRKARFAVYVAQNQHLPRIDAVGDCGFGCGLRPTGGSTATDGAGICRKSPTGYRPVSPHNGSARRRALSARRRTPGRKQPSRLHKAGL